MATPSIAVRLRYFRPFWGEPPITRIQGYVLCVRPARFPRRPELAIPSLPRARNMAALVVVILALALVVPGASTASAPDGNPWTAVSSIAGLSSRQADIRTNHFAGFSLNRDLMKSGLDRAPQATGLAPAAVIIPTPAGDFQRFAMVDAPVMEPGLAAAHPEIRTFAGKGIVDPYFHADQSLYASYYGHDLASPGPLVEPEDIEQLIQDLPPALTEPVVKLRTYRLALVTDPSYATFFGAENVTAAKVTLINRVAQIYEDETAI